MPILYDELQNNDELKSFHSKHAGSSAFGEEDIAKSQEILEECFTKLENTLEEREWIMGDQFTLADISWVPLHVVLLGCGYPFERFPNISRWAAAFREKESYQEGILKWCLDFSKE